MMEEVADDVEDGVGDARKIYLKTCVPLMKYALRGDWENAQPFLLHQRMLVNAGIAKGHPTMLHLAAGANHFHFVKQLLNYLNEDDLALQDSEGNTALCLAAGVGNIKLVEIMLQKTPSLPGIRNREGLTPLHIAAIQAKRQMTSYLYNKTKQTLEDVDRRKLFFICIQNDIVGIALDLLNNMEGLALAKDEKDETALHVLAKKTSSFSDIQEIIKGPLFGAAEVGNFEFLVVLLKKYPYLIWEVDNRNRTIIHIAALYQHPKIMNLIHDISPIKVVILTLTDIEDGNNILHLAAKVTPSNRFELVTGAAFEMICELVWFEVVCPYVLSEVKKIMLPLHIEKRNLEGLTPQQLFSREHAKLRQHAADWMKFTASSCMLVSSLIASGMFSIAFGITEYASNPTSLTFAISNALALVSSLISFVAFLSVLTSRYEEHDFHKSLPRKLMTGLLTLCLAISFMILAYYSGFYITYFGGKRWVSDPLE
ncbi:uncharacterized protein LOC129322445 [Prosopis cineraria]|uniref:uncharacterized protein LOC129322445 n=1 Tax=Prosopis cineraria TaxID=364024 RepID=UPI00240F85D7|nr:uncharacterized protein LOC129322445 [Prosopis cineraria]